MSYHNTVQYLYNLQKYGMKFGLDNIRRLSALLNNPHETFLSVHVAGTNGKGSTSAMIASILQSAGFRVGLFTSPHLVSFTERIRINGEEIEEHEVINLTGEIRDIVAHCNDFSPTFFEVVTAIAMLFFKSKMVEIAVFETGMGGRLDATNILNPLVTVLTSINYDHREFLGATLQEIAGEKAGIIKPGVPVVSSRQEPDAETVIRARAGTSNAGISFYGHDFSSVLKKDEIDGIRFDYRSQEAFFLDDLFVPLPGEHQMENASVAIKAAMICLKSPACLPAPYPTLQREEMLIRAGLENVRWPGRLQFFKGPPSVLLDGAHNPSAASALARSLQRTFQKKYKNIILVMGIMADKDIRGIMEPLLPLASRIVFTAPAYSRAATPDTLAHLAWDLGYDTFTTAPTVQSALDIAKTLAVSGGNDALIVVTGSFYTLGEATEAFGQKGILANLRE
jgi:dihydrofolate synthase / folylpolyglutamate synthase